MLSPYSNKTFFFLSFYTIVVIPPRNIYLQTLIFNLLKFDRIYIKSEYNMQKKTNPTIVN